MAITAELDGHNQQDGGIGPCGSEWESINASFPVLLLPDFAAGPRKCFPLCRHWQTPWPMPVSQT